MSASLRFVLVPCLLISRTSAATAGTGLFQISQAARVIGLSALRSQGQPAGDAASRTLAALDADRDGRVSPSEVTSFAVSQGLDASSAAREFSAMDADGDGVLDASEVDRALGGSSAARPAAPAGAATPAEVKLPAPVALPEKQKVTAAAAAPRAVAAVAADVVAPAATPKRKRGRKFMATRLAARHGAGAEAAAAGAGRAATRVVRQLSLETKEEEQARALDLWAAELRANATRLARLTAQRAEKAASDAALSKADELLEDVTALDRRAARDEERAAELRARSRADALEAEQLIAVAGGALKKH